MVKKVDVAVRIHQNMFQFGKVHPPTHVIKNSVLQMSILYLNTQLIIYAAAIRFCEV